MEEDRIENLMREAEAAGGTPRVGADLAGRVFHAAERRRRARVATRVAAVVGLMVGVGWMGGRYWGEESSRGTVTGTRPASGPAKQFAGDMASLKAELVEIRREADWRWGLAMSLWEAERRREDGWSDGSGEAREHVEYAAFSMVRQADRIVRQAGLKAPAVKVYRQVERDFSATRWAEVARQRLAELGEGKAG